MKISETYLKHIAVFILMISFVWLGFNLRYIFGSLRMTGIEDDLPRKIDFFSLDNFYWHIPITDNIWSYFYFGIYLILLLFVVFIFYFFARLADKYIHSVLLMLIMLGPYIALGFVSIYMYMFTRNRIIGDSPEFLDSLTQIDASSNFLFTLFYIIPIIGLLYYLYRKSKYYFEYYDRCIRKADIVFDWPKSKKESEPEFTPTIRKPFHIIRIPFFIILLLFCLNVYFMFETSKDTNLDNKYLGIYKCQTDCFDESYGFKFATKKETEGGEIVKLYDYRDCAYGNSAFNNGCKWRLYLENRLGRLYSNY